MARHRQHQEHARPQPQPPVVMPERAVQEFNGGQGNSIAAEIMNEPPDRSGIQGMDQRDLIRLGRWSVDYKISAKFHKDVEAFTPEEAYLKFAELNGLVTRKDKETGIVHVLSDHIPIIVRLGDVEDEPTDDAGKPASRQAEPGHFAGQRDGLPDSVRASPELQPGR